MKPHNFRWIAAGVAVVLGFAAFVYIIWEPPQDLTTHRVQVIDGKSGMPLAGVYVHLAYRRRVKRLFAPRGGGCLAPDVITQTDQDGYYEAPLPDVPKKERQRIAHDDKFTLLMIATLFKPGYLPYQTDPPATYNSNVKKFFYNYNAPPQKMAMKPMALSAIEKMDYYWHIQSFMSNNCGRSGSDPNSIPTPLGADITRKLRTLVDGFYQEWRTAVIEQGKQPEKQLAVMTFLKRIGYEKRGQQAPTASDTNETDN